MASAVAVLNYLLKNRTKSSAYAAAAATKASNSKLYQLYPGEGEISVILLSSTYAATASFCKSSVQI